MLATDRRALVADATFSTLFADHAPYVLRVMRHLGVAERDIQDQCQEVFVAVFRGLSGFAGRSSLRTWIYGICVRVASNHRRRAHVRRERPVSELPEQASPAVQDEALEERRGHPSLRRWLDRLAPEQRDVFVLYELEELSMKEVAEVCGCPLQTAYSRLHAARRRLLEAYRELEESP
jgi:RNA polymerase sigma-70 factor (ECF subfamily)